jgi:chromosome segregation ATPase
MGSRLRLVTVKQSAFFLLTSLLAAGCHDAGPNLAPATQKSTAQAPAQNPVAASSNGIEPILSPAEQHRQAEQRVMELEKELTKARAQQMHLVQKREEISARIAAHQEEGMQLLTSLKAQKGTSSGNDEAYAAAARSQLETALAQDTELNRELELAENELSDLDAKIGTLTADLAAVRNVQTAKSDSVAR